MRGSIITKQINLLGVVFIAGFLTFSSHGQGFPAWPKPGFVQKPFNINNSPGETYYVDDDNTAGPWLGTEGLPFNKISQGIYKARNGDTVFVKSGTYSEGSNPGHRIFYSINLIGENKFTTVIDEFPNSADVISIHTGKVRIQGFTIRGSNSHAGIGIRDYLSDNYNNNIIEDNLILDSHCGIDLYRSNNNKIRNNIIKNPVHGGTYGIVIKESSHNKVYGNEIDLSYQQHAGGYSLMIIAFCGLGINNPPANNNIIWGNTFDHSQANMGNTHILVQTCSYGSGHGCNCFGTRIIGNVIRNLGNSGCGVRFYNPLNSTVSGNIFNNHDTNGMNAYSFGDYEDNNWNGNYWDDYSGTGGFYNIYGGLEKDEAPSAYKNWLMDE